MRAKYRALKRFGILVRRIQRHQPQCLSHFGEHEVSILVPIEGFAPFLTDGGPPKA
jgi:hypothetical protein